MDVIFLLTRLLQWTKIKGRYIFHFRQNGETEGRINHWPESTKKLDKLYEQGISDTEWQAMQKGDRWQKGNQLGRPKITPKFTPGEILMELPCLPEVSIKWKYEEVSLFMGQEYWIGGNYAKRRKTGTISWMAFNLLQRILNVILKSMRSHWRFLNQCVRFIEQTNSGFFFQILLLLSSTKYKLPRIWKPKDLLWQVKNFKINIIAALFWFILTSNCWLK